MKKYFPLPLLLVMTAAIFIFVGFDADSDLKINDLFTEMEVAEVETVKVEGQGTEQIPNEMTYYAYDAVFSLSFATLEVGKDDNGITLNEDGDTRTYTFDNTSYRKDDPDATVTGYMKAISGETTDRSDVSFTFVGDPQGLETITIKSSGAHGEAHIEGELIINGEESSFAQFVAYFGSRMNR